MKREIDDLKNKLKNKEAQLAENLRFIDEIQNNVRSSRTSGPDNNYTAIRDLQNKQSRLEEENAQLRETLRNEILSSERQRSQLEIACEALNDKLSSMKVLTARSKNNPTDLFFEYEMLYRRLEQSEAEIQNLTDKQNSLQNHLNVISEENMKLNQNVQDFHFQNQRLSEDLQNSI
jgi:chromosome segregation ATPase